MRDWALDEILHRSNGNFLYATLMIEQLKTAFTISDVEEIITCDTPDEYFSDAYKRFFNFHYNKKSERKYVMYVDGSTNSRLEYMYIILFSC